VKSLDPKILLVSLISFSLLASAQTPEIYVVQKGDSLSMIAYKYCRKVHGDTGFIAQIKKINPKLDNSVYPGLKIKIPTDESLCLLKHIKPDKVQMDTIELKVVTPEVKKPEVIKPEVIKPIIAKPIEVEIKEKIVKTKKEKKKKKEKKEVIEKVEEKVEEKTAAVSKPYAQRVWGADIMIGSKSLKAEDDTRDDAVVNTKHLVNVGLSYKFSWSESNRSRLGGWFGVEEYLDSDRSIDNPSFSRTKIALGHEYQPNNNTFDLELGVKQLTFVGRSDVNEVNLEIVPVEFVSLGWKYDLLRTAQYDFRVGVVGSYLMTASGTDIRLKEGHEAMLLAQVEDARGIWEIFYLYGKQDTNLFINNFDTIGVKYTLNFGGRE
jgi:hypothetical protein